MREAAARPERGGVVARLVGIGTAHAVAVAARVHQPREARPHRLGVEPEPSQRAGSHVREQHVGRVEELIEQRAAFGSLQVDRDRALAAIRQRHRQIDPAAVSADPLRREAAVRVAFNALDAHDVGTPVGEQRTGDRHEDPLRQLHHAHAVERAWIHACSVPREPTTATAKTRHHSGSLVKAEMSFYQAWESIDGPRSSGGPR